MVEITACIMNIVFTAFAIYGIFAARKWHAAAKRMNDFLETAKKELEDGK